MSWALQAKRGLNTHMRSIKMHVVGCLSMQQQVDWMLGLFKHMSGMTKVWE